MDLKKYLTATAYAADCVETSDLEHLVSDIMGCWWAGRTVFTCGNGGSAANASHLAQDLGKGTLIDPCMPLATICLCDSVSSLTAWTNDEGYEIVFSRQVNALGSKGDLLIAISGSGNSPNVLNAVDRASVMGIKSWGITGFDGGKLRRIADCSVHVPCENMGIVEAVHGILFHWLVEELRERMAASLGGHGDTS